eukprot:10494100-Alexandrium_andersonii.AAC.1
MAGHIASSLGGAPPGPPERGASGAPAGPFRCQIRHQRGQLFRRHPAAAREANSEVFSGTAQF